MEGAEKYNCIVKDKILFEPYMNDGYRAVLSFGRKKITVRYKGVNLKTDKDHPFEVLYPGNNEAVGYQTAEDVFKFINPNVNFEDIR